jgi:hypothetical protein
MNRDGVAVFANNKGSNIGIEKNIFFFCLRYN